MAFDNPLHTNGFAFLEFATSDAPKLIQQFESMGFVRAARHLMHDVMLYQQNNICFLINTSPQSHASEFATLHGPSVSAMGFRVQHAQTAFQHALDRGAQPYIPLSGEMAPYTIPAIYGVGNSLIYFVDEPHNQPNYLSFFSALPTSSPTCNANLVDIDHVTHNLYRGEMDKWADFYTRIFNFREIRYFDIEGQLTGLKSRAMTSPCGKIRIPLNESSDDYSQIEEFLKDFNGEGIQHIALSTQQIYDSVETLRQQGLQFLETPDTYYELINQRLPHHAEPLDRLKQLGLLMDGNSLENKILLQIFTKNMLGPVFFEIIQRKGDEGFGEGNFRALFESIELDQIRRGVLAVEG